MANGKPGRPRKVQPTIESLTPDARDEMGPRDEPAQEPHPAEQADREASREARTETRHGFGRRERKPLGVPRLRLHAEVPDGMTGRWMNDDPGRIDQALEGGYQFISSNKEVVQDREGCRTELVGTGRSGGAKKGYLMAIPTVLYEQDQAAKASRTQDMEDSIVRGEPQQAAAQDTNKYYVPDEGISLRHTQVDR